MSHPLPIVILSSSVSGQSFRHFSRVLFTSTYGLTQGLPCCLLSRFVSLPVDTLQQKLQGQTRSIEGEVEKLGQRLLYLETTQKNSREHIEQMLRNK